MERLKLTGTVWLFGDNVDTDQINPGKYLDAPVDEASRHVFEAIAPEFVNEFKAGEMIVAGSNFGCGSSRETAPDALKYLGVAAVIAESFGRIFFRNAIAIGLLPDAPIADVVYVGNPAIGGAKLAALSGEAREILREIVKRTTCYDLMGTDDYVDQFKQAMFLPHTNIELFPSVHIGRPAGRETR